MTFDEFMAERLGPLLIYATTLTCDPYLAQDITQDVMVKVHRKWRVVSAADSPEGYVRRMIVNEFLSWRRRRSSSEMSIEGDALARIEAPADAFVAINDRDAMMHAIAVLPPRQRAAVVLRYLEDLSDQQIAVLLGCRPPTVRSQISRALATLRASPSFSGSGLSREDNPVPAATPSRRHS